MIKITKNFNGMFIFLENDLCSKIAIEQLELLKEFTGIDIHIQKILS